MYIQYFKSPVGNLEIVANDTSILVVSFVDDIKEDTPNEWTMCCIAQLKEYFQGKRSIFDLPLNPSGTPFQKKVWNALQQVPYGTTCSYKQIAIACGNEKASRAIGMANNRNPIVIIIPCHRIVGANGKLVGYRGGLDKKEYLLKIEQK